MEENGSVLAFVIDLFENLKFEAASDYSDGIEHLRDRPLSNLFERNLIAGKLVWGGGEASPSETRYRW